METKEKIKTNLTYFLKKKIDLDAFLATIK